MGIKQVIGRYIQSGLLCHKGRAGRSRYKRSSETSQSV
ncbi:hypothetical protein NC653_020973 [Populus alba x Populus x berolinensis]|uniref:Uncharacterized protein n=1 Tax=Populus alba x Populus x berolinensis TaxID=444605 RepID=A0AAD6MLS2_9ROSI|nr:hypothetical protein NC653_020973 [Populus alba x Populus x berolinensis]